MREPGFYIDGYVTPSDIKNYAYCPVIPWVEANLGVREPPTPSMESALGAATASFKERVAGELRLPKPWRIEVPLSSSRLRLRGVVDVVAGERRLVVLEVKVFDRRLSRAGHFRAQLLAYALLVNETMGPVGEAILYLGGRVYRLHVGDRELEEARRMLEKARRAVESPEPPLVQQPEAKCRYCWHRRWCPVA